MAVKTWPWTVNEYGTILGTNKKTILVEGVALPSISTPESIANTRLILFAPELLIVCTAIKMARDMGFAAADILAPDSNISRALDAAILKATGEA